MNLYAFADSISEDIVIRRAPFGAWTASFEACGIMQDGGVFFVSDPAATPEEAVRLFAARISETSIIFHHGTRAARVYRVPKLEA